MEYIILVPDILVVRLFTGGVQGGENFARAFSRFSFSLDLRVFFDA